MGKRKNRVYINYEEKISENSFSDWTIISSNDKLLLNILRTLSGALFLPLENEKILKNM
jgi:hypothetical protein